MLSSIKSFFFLPYNWTQKWSAKTLLSKQTGRWSNFQKLIALQFYGWTLKDLQSRSVGALWLVPSIFVRLASYFGVKHNLNHLGNVYSLSPQDLSLSQRVEKNVIEWLKKLLSAPSKTEGYVTSGGTESNLFLMWLGREYCRKQSRSQLLVCKTDFTHYSVSKAARILDIPQENIAINEDSYAMDTDSLNTLLKKKLKKNPKLGVLIPVTLGYSSIGTCDPLLEIVSVCDELKKEFPGFLPYIWIDASMQGLPLLFLDPFFQHKKIFFKSYIFGYCVDFHKFGGTPLPTGVVLYRPELRALIEQPIDYLLEKDATVLGSRPGFAALALWFAISARTLIEWREHFEKMLATKEKFQKKLLDSLLPFKVVSYKYSLTGALLCDTFSTGFSEKLENRYLLNFSTITYMSKRGVPKKLKHYKLHFNLNIFDRFFQDINYFVASTKSR